MYPPPPGPFTHTHLRTQTVSFFTHDRDPAAAGA